MPNKNISDCPEILLAMLVHKVIPGDFKILISSKNSLNDSDMFIFQLKTGEEINLSFLSMYLEDGSLDEDETKVILEFEVAAEKIGIINPLLFAKKILDEGCEILCSMYWHYDYYDDFEKEKEKIIQKI